MPPFTSTSGPHHPSELAQALRSTPAGEHVCLVYESDPEEQIRAVVPFLQHGLENGERVIYIADDSSVEDVGRWLRSADSDVEGALRTGSLLLWTRREWRQPGDLDALGKTAQAQAVIAEAEALGFRGIRFAVEMTWTLASDIPADQVEHGESTINTFIAGPFPVRFMCQYNRNRLGAAIVGAGLRTHPTAVIGGDVCPNPYYEAPSFLQNASGDSRVDWMLSQLQRSQSTRSEREARLAAAAIDDVARNKREIEDALRAGKEAAETLRAAVTAKDQVLAMLSHELRTPATVLLGTASLLKYRAGTMTEAEHRQTVEDAYDEALRLNLVVHGLFSLANAASGTAPEVEPLLLNHLVRAVAQEFGARQGHTVQVVTGEAMMVHGDARALEDLVDKLLSNADLYSPAGEPIEIELSAGGDGNCVTTVRDRGIGVADAEFDLLFTPFFRSARVKHLRGVGLGLALSRRIVAQHGGQISAVQREGGGAEFSFSLPLFAE